MCSRLTLTVDDPRALLAQLGLDPDAGVIDAYMPRYNVAPTQPHWVMVPGAQVALCQLRWGLGTRRQINARVETLATRGLVRGQRPCVVPATGFLEWEGPKKARQPVYFTPAQGPLMLMAGVADLSAFTVLTTTAAGVVLPVHDRMPLLLDGPAAQRWLASQGTDLQAATVELSARRVSSRINKAAHDDPACLEDAPSGARDGETPSGQLRLL